MEVLLMNEDTIAAVATGMGGAGIGIIRISGNKAIEIGGNTPPEKIMSDMGYSEFVGLFFIE